MAVEFDKNGFALNSGSVLVYGYDQVNYELTGSYDTYVVIGTGVPGHSTLQPPLSNKNGYAIVFSLEKNEWVYVEDHRGTAVYDKESQYMSTVDYLGPIDNKVTTKKPATIYDVWDGDQWKTNTDAQKESLIAQAENQKTSLLDLATQKIAPLQDAVDLDMATEDEKAQLLAWKKYRVLVNRVDTSTAPNITWPTSPDDESTTAASTATNTGDATTI